MSKINSCFIFSLLLLFLNLTSITTVFSQYQHVGIVLPPSPQAVSLGKYGEMPVNLYTGQVANDFKLYEFIEGDIKLPITLRHNYSGCKVLEHASWVGLGFSLDAGGVITRVVKGRPDEFPWGVLNTSIDDLTRDKQKANNVAAGFDDTEPDVFYFNFFGQAGEFYLDKENNEIKAKTIVKSNLKIYPPHEIEGGRGRLDKEWKIIDGMGNTYYFGQTEASIEITTYQPLGSGEEIFLLIDYPSAFYLTKVISQKGNQLNFTYEKNDRIRTHMTSQVQYKSLEKSYGCNNLNSKGESFVLNDNVLLKSVIGTQGSIHFDANTARQDHQGTKCLDEIRVNDPLGKLSRKWQFSYGYFNAEYGNEKRLKLDSFSEIGTASNQDLTHAFSYHEDRFFPNLSTTGIDHWGYYNGVINNNNLVPQITNCNDPNGAFPRLGAYDQIADRKSNELYGKIGMLKKVTYPTKGTSEFEYESHDFAPETLCEKIDFLEKTYTAASVNLRYTDPNIYNDVIDEHAFTILNDQEVDIQLYADVFNNHGPVNMITSYAEILDQQNNILYAVTFENVYNKYFESKLFLNAGSYKVRIRAENPQQGLIYADSFSFGVVVNYLGTTVINKAQIGGLRIKKIINSDGTGNVNIRSFKYTQQDEKISSGFLHFYPIYASRFSSKDCGYEGNLNCIKISASSISPIGYVNGSHIGYSRVVEEMLSGKGNGSIINIFSLEKDYSNRYSAFTYHHKENWKMGLLLEKTYLKNNGDSVSVFKNIYEKGEYNVNDHDVRGVIVNRTYFASSGWLNQGQLQCYAEPLYHEYDFHHYVVKLLHEYNLKTSIEMNYVKRVDGRYDIVKRQIDYKYENPTTVNPTQTILTDSKGSVHMTKVKFPKDMVSLNLDTDGTYSAMLSSNIVEPIVEESHFLGEDHLVSRKRVNFKLFLGSTYLPESIYMKYGAAEEFQQAKFLKYSSRGNPLSILQLGKIPVNYIWSYGNQNPIAEVSGVDYATMENLLGGDALINQFSSQNPSLLQVNSFITPLRNDSKTFIKSFSYQPLVGMVSETDIKGMTTYYEYDSFQRLKYIKDQNGQVMKSFDYHYKPQTN